MEKLKLIRLGNVYNNNHKGSDFGGNVWDKKGLCPALTTMQGGGRMPMIIVSMDTWKLGENNADN